MDIPHRLYSHTDVGDKWGSPRVLFGGRFEVWGFPPRGSGPHGMKNQNFPEFDLWVRDRQSSVLVDVMVEGPVGVAVMICSTLGIEV